ncbi:MAG: ABC transporter ATP-binding protein [Proteobacteria bacterium]|nr:ABC transporter ATP-binding protein [Pseudomonadota bacterium]
MLKVQNLSAGYGPVQVLWDINLAVSAGEVVCVVGRNGVGKSTLLNTIAGLADCRSGALSLSGESIAQLSTAQRARAGIGYVPQQREICPDLTVEENLLVPIYALGLEPAKLSAVYDGFARLKERRYQVAGSLSGGERKLLAFARIMLCSPKIFLIDEPTEGLMPSAVVEISGLIAGCREEGAAVLLVEQNLRVIEAVADRIYLMNSGRIELTLDKFDETQIVKYLGV